MAEEKKTGAEEQVRAKPFVLVVDGNPRDALTTGMLLQNFGYTVTSVKSVDEALEFISIAVPSLIIMELVLPDKSGQELLGRLRQALNLAIIPVIVQTSISDIETEGRCRAAGCTLYLRKPVNPENLYRAVQSTIEPTPRQNLRVSTYLRVSVGGSGQGIELITVLSDNGMFIKSLSPRPVGSTHTVSFMINRRVIKTGAVVLYTYAFGEGPYKDPGMGMKFTDILPEDRELIRQFIRQQVTPPIDRQPSCS
jgi:two-component system cell cycle response regulator DivK